MTSKEKSKPSSGLEPHQIKALKKLDETGGVILDHSMGSGKTKTFLTAIAKAQADNPSGEALAVAPASLTSNIDKEIKKHRIKIDPHRLTALSYEKAVIEADKLRKKKWAIAVLDEAHKTRNTDTKRHQELSEIVQGADKRVLATGTTTYNHVSDIAPLVNMAAGEDVLPTGKAFTNRYVNKVVEHPPLLKRVFGYPAKETHKLQNKAELKKVLQKYVHRYDVTEDPKMKDKFPEKRERIVEVEMSPSQQTMYKYLEQKLPWHLRLKVRANMPLDRKDAAALNSFSTGIRQVSNSTREYLPNLQESTPKIHAAVSSMVEGHTKDKNFRGVAYSNYLGSGLSEYSRELSKTGIPHVVFHGGMSKAEKDAAVESYNKGEVKVILLSSSGTEGLNLKGTKKIQVLEPHFNKAKIDQVVARGVRYESHKHLPKKERVVEVEHYHSVFPKNFMGKRSYSIDQYLHHNSKTKDELGEEMKSLVKQSMAKWKLFEKAVELAKKSGKIESEVGAIPVGAFSKNYVNKYLHKVINMRAANPELARPYARLSFMPSPKGKAFTNYMNPNFFREIPAGEAGW